MKKKLNDLLNGNIKYVKERPKFSQESLSGTVVEQEVYRGIFSMEATGSAQIKGTLHCNNARVGFRPATFSGYHENFVFEVDTKGLVAGDKITGDFILQTSMGEYTIPLDLTVEEMHGAEKQPLMTKEEFLQKAREDFSEAYTVFLSKEFQRAVVSWGYHYVNLYRGIREQQITYTGLEEFLVGAKLKEKVKLSLEKDTLELQNVEESVQEGLILNKENWGFASLNISSDAPFLKILHPHVSTEEFAGSKYEIRFVIDRAFLHAGKNVAKITILNGYEEITATVKVHNDQRFLPANEIHRQRQEIMQMISAYIDYQTEKIGEAEWIGVSSNAIENYHKIGGRHIFYDMYEAYLADKAGKKDKALSMISRISERKEELKDPAMYGIYLVLTRQMNPNANYQEWVKEHLQTLYLENQENWIIQWLILKVNPETIRNDIERLDLIRRQFVSGCHSPIMYLEAYKILKKEPLMLRNLENFEIHLMQFICRENLLDREISGQAAQIASRMNSFQPLLFRILCKCFEVYPTKNMLTAICNLLISGKMRKKEYAAWYALGIKQDVRITGLYEYYVETADRFDDKMLPAAVRMYFIYHNTLDYAKKAAIYANIVKNKEEDPESFDTYCPSMERFAEEQVERGHINADLAILYENLLVGELLTPAIAAGLERILYSCQIQVQNSRIREVLVYHEESSLEQRAEVEDGTCYVQLFSPDAVIIMEDVDGVRYALPEEYTIRKMIDNPELEKACRQILKNPTAIRIHTCSKDGSEVKVTPEMVAAYIDVLRVPGIKDHYSEKVRRQLLEYFKEHIQDECLDEFLGQEEMRPVMVDKIGDYAVLLASREHFQKIMDMIRVYGMEKIDVDVLLATCNYCILKQDYAEDEMLLAVCEYCYKRQKYDNVLLKFMMRYYEGSIEDMKSVWNQSTDSGMESMDMETRILSTVVLTEEHLDGTEQIFDSYEKRPAKPVLLKTYAILMAYEYFVREREVKAAVFRYLESQMMNGNTPDVCRLALMKYLTYSKERTETQTRLLQRMVEHYQNLGMRFAFYMDLPQQLKEALNIRDKFFVEYRCTPNSDVILRYRINDIRENGQIMQEVFEGIYVKEFTLFYGDEMEWYFQRKDKQELSEKHEMVYQPKEALKGNTRYSLINRMIAAKNAQDEQAYQEVKKQYVEQQYLVEKLFPL